MGCVCSIKGIRKREPREQDTGTRYLPASFASAGEAGEKILARVRRYLARAVKFWGDANESLFRLQNQIRWEHFGLFTRWNDHLAPPQSPETGTYLIKCCVFGSADCLCRAVPSAFGRTFTSWLSIYCHLVDDRKLTAFYCFWFIIIVWLLIIIRWPWVRKKAAC